MIYGGTLFEKAALDKMLADAEVLSSLGDTMMKTIQEIDAEAAVKRYRELKAANPAAYRYTESELVALGYALLSGKKVEDAIAVFKLSVDEYPRSYNTWDSLAEAYMNHGDKALAIQDYKKSLELNPANANATKMLEKLGAP